VFCMTICSSIRVALEIDRYAVSAARLGKSGGRR
jgi:hypothetical protein